MRNTIPCSNVISSSAKLESVLVICSISAHCLLQGYAYIPPNLPASTYSEFRDTIDEAVISVKNSVALFPILGDFNLPGAKFTWNANNYLWATDSSHHLHELAATLDLKLLNLFLNYRQVCLDFVFSLLHWSEVSAAEDLLWAEERHYPTLSVVLNIPKASSAQHTRLQNMRPWCSFFRQFQDCELLVLTNVKSKLTISSLISAHG